MKNRADGCKKYKMAEISAEIQRFNHQAGGEIALMEEGERA